MRSLMLTLLAVLVLFPCRALAIDEAHQKKAEALIERAIVYLRTQQDAKTGGWAVNPQGPAFPAISALVINGMLLQPGLTDADPTVKSGIAYILKYRQPDGGIYDHILPSYNTSIALSALARVNTPEARAAVKTGQDFLRSLQFGESAATSGPAAREVQKVDKAHPFYGGVGYGRSGRPDLSNTEFFLQALQDTGVPGDDPAVQRALVFIQRCQMDGRVNDMPYAKQSRQGGFIYSTSENKDEAGTGSSEVTTGRIEETLDDGTKVSNLRAYGSMTYSGFKSYLHAQLKKDDPRVRSALEWIRKNYTLRENPGIGADGLYYYALVFARALHAWNEPTILAADANSPPHDWANDLIDRLAELQNEDGSFKSVGKRWMEDNPVLITAYSLLALQNAVR